MLEISKIKVGDIIEKDNQPLKVVRASFSKIGRQGAVLRTKLKNLISGNVSDITFRDSDKLKKAEITREKAQYLYNQDNQYFFMNLNNYEQFSFDKEILGNLTNFLKEQCEVQILLFNDQPTNIELPVKLDFEVTEAPPATRGNTAEGGSKKIKIQTGYTLDAPLFIKQGDKIKINTTDGKYVERVAE
ncbi:MAG: elongation factor P [Candidatus Moranbacteria bacterium]|nr:elongation factor P [Candidatus Moranbacteria bacterium]